MYHAIFGIFFHWLGGLAAGSFYVPYKGIRKWSWETYWLVGGFFAWIICPVFLAGLLTSDLVGVIGSQTAATLGWTCFFGMLWGIGGLTFGLAIRYLGLSLGTGVALGYCAAFGTLLPPLLKTFDAGIPVPETLGQIAATSAGQVTLLGIFVTLIGIGVAAFAGLRKEREMSAADKKMGVAEFNFSKGLIAATFSGIMSACFAFALTAGNPIGESAAAAGTPLIWTGLPKLVVVLAGGFATNFIWCVWLNVRNRSHREYLAVEISANHTPEAEAKTEVERAPRVPLLRNYLLSALAGTIWYFQFFFYTMGETQMGRFGFASWTLHMASIIIFSTLWGCWFREWSGCSSRVRWLITTGIGLLILSTVIIGYGTWMQR